MRRAALASVVVAALACGEAPAASHVTPEASPLAARAESAPSAAPVEDVDARLIDALSVVRQAPSRATLEALAPDVRGRLLHLVEAPATPPLARQRALTALGAWPEDAAIGALFETHLHDEGAPIARRVRMLRLLAESHPERALPALAWAACQPDARLRAGARRAADRLMASQRGAVDEALRRCADEGR